MGESMSCLPSSTDASGVSDVLYLRRKEFYVRESLFTMVLKNSPEAKAIYSIVASQLFMFTLYTIIMYYIDPSVYQRDVNFVSSQLSGIGAFFDSWIKMHAALLLVIYPCTKLWMQYECKYFALYALSLSPALLFIVIHPVYTLLENNFLYLLTFSMTVEQVNIPFSLYSRHSFNLLKFLSSQVRILMKTISFIVENHRKIMAAKKMRSISTDDTNNNLFMCDKISEMHNNRISRDQVNEQSVGYVEKNSREEGKINCHIPRLDQLVYFLFAPTLIYRDEYPRSCNKEIRWRRVVSLLSEFGAICFLGLQIVNRVTTPRLKDVGLRELRLPEIIDDYILFNMISVVCTFGLGYCFLHCWLNAWAEILRFGDREFYKTWWTSTNFSQFWRRWNGVVQPWIYEYLYKPMIYVTGGNRVISTLTVFLVSALVHEHVTGFALGGLLPMFGLAMLAFCPFIVAFHFLRHLNDFHASVFVFSVNWIIWSTTLFGYGLESFCRVNCPLSQDEPLIELIKPRVLSCLRVKLWWIYIFNINYQEWCLFHSSHSFITYSTRVFYLFFFLPLLLRLSQNNTRLQVSLLTCKCVIKQSSW